MLIPIRGEGIIDNDSDSTVASVIRPKFRGRLSIVDTLLSVTTAINSGLTAQPLINIYRHTVGPATVLNPTTGLVGIHDFVKSPILQNDIVGTLYQCASIGRIGGRLIPPGRKLSGTITVTGSSATVTGTNTRFNSEVRYGDVLVTDSGQFCRVQARSSDTAITADRNFVTNESNVDAYLTVSNPRENDDLANGWVTFTENDFIWAAISTEGSGGTVAGGIQAIFAIDPDPTFRSGHYLV